MRLTFEVFTRLSSSSLGYWWMVPYFNGAHLLRSFRTQLYYWRLSWRLRWGVWHSICQTAPPLIIPIYAASALLPQVHVTGWGAEPKPTCSSLLKRGKKRRGFFFETPNCAETPDPVSELIIKCSLCWNFGQDTPCWRTRGITMLKRILQNKYQLKVSANIINVIVFLVFVFLTWNIQVIIAKRKRC